MHRVQDESSQVEQTTPPQTGTGARATAHAATFLVPALAFGLLAGYGELAFLGLQKLLLGRIVFLGRHAWWMMPLAEALVFTALALIILGLAQLIPILRKPSVAFGVPAFLFTVAGLLLVPRIHPAAAVLFAAGVGIQTGRVAARHTTHMRRYARNIALGLALILVSSTLGGVIIGARFATAGTHAKAGAPNILLLILDTVRASSLSLYGHSRPTTPRLDALGARSVVFDNAIAAAPWTLPSHASMFTGLSPDRLSTDWRVPLDDVAPTIAEHLAAHGYDTSGFVANLAYCSRESGLARGFAHYEEEPITVRQVVVSSALVRKVVTRPWFRDLIGTDENFVRKSAADINRSFLSWLGGRNSDRPFFAFLNYYDAHAPYMPPEPFRSRFGADARGNISPLHRWNSDPFEPVLADSVIAQERAAYEAATAYLDDRIGSLLDELERRGLLENTIVVVTSDHGEEFGEHKIYDHGNSLYMEGIRVPLLVYRPGALDGGRRVEEPVSLTGLAAMLARLAGVENGAPFPDRRLADVLYGARVDTTPALTEVTRASGLPDWFPVSRGHMVSLVTPRWHYIRNGDGKEELYDLSADRVESTNVAGAFPNEMNLLREHLNGWRSRRLRSNASK